MSLFLLGPYCFCPLLCPSLHKIYFGISNFFEEISSLSQIVSSVSLHWCLRKAFLPFLHILWKSAFNWVSVQFNSVQSLSHVRLFETPGTAARQASLSITNSWSPPKPMSIETVMPSIISSFVVPFSFCPESFPASGSFQINQLFASGGQSIGVSASKSVLLMNTQDWSPLRWTGCISLQS